MDFLGLYNHSLDAKNRIFIPSKYREYLGDTFVVCKAPDTCLYIYSQEEWEAIRIARRQKISVVDDLLWKPVEVFLLSHE